MYYVCYIVTHTYNRYSLLFLYSYIVFVSQSSVTGGHATVINVSPLLQCYMRAPARTGGYLFVRHSEE